MKTYGMALLLGLLGAGCASTPAAVPEIRPGLLAGLLRYRLPSVSGVRAG